MSGAGAITLGSVSFGPAHSLRVDVEDSMAASIIRLEQENEELRAEVALLQEQANMTARTLERIRTSRDEYKRMAGISSDWETMESVREKYDPRDEAEEMET